MGSDDLAALEDLDPVRQPAHLDRLAHEPERHAVAPAPFETAVFSLSTRAVAGTPPAGGVRIGTAEIYRQVEKLDEVLESIVVGQHWQGDVRIVLFVVLKNGLRLDDTLINKVKAEIRASCTPRHVPAKIVQVADIPRTKSGKITELAVRDVVHGRPVKNIESLANPDSLAAFKDVEALKS